MKIKIFGFFKKEHLQFLKFAHEYKIEINPNLRYIGIIFTIFAYFLLGNSTILFETNSSKASFFQLFFLQFLTVFISYLICLLPRGWKAFKPKNRKLILIRGTLGIITYYTYFLSKIWVDVIDNSLLFSIDSLVIPLIMYIFFRIYIGKIAIIGILIGFLGICFVNILDVKFYSLGGLIGIISGIGLALIIVMTTYMVKRDSPLLIAFYQSIIGVISSGLIMCFISWEPLDLHSYITIIFQGFLYAAALFLFIDAFFYTETYIIGALGYSLTIFIIFLENLFLGKVIDIYSSIGTILVCGGGIILIINSYYKDRKINYKN